MLEEAYKRVMAEAKEAPPGKHYKKGSDRLYSNGHTSDGDPDGGSRLNSDPTYKNPNESQEQEDLSKMHKFGNVQFQHLGKDRNGAEAFRVYKDGSYVLYATMYGPRKTVTLYADPEADGQQTAGPEEGKALKEFDKTQVPGGIEQVAAKLGASENAEDHHAAGIPEPSGPEEAPDSWQLKGGRSPAGDEEGTYPEDWHENKREFKEGQYVYGKGGMEIISNIDKQGVITTYILDPDEGNTYKPGTEEYEELDDYDEYVKYDRMSTYRPAYGEY